MTGSHCLKASAVDGSNQINRVCVRQRRAGDENREVSKAKPLWPLGYERLFRRTSAGRRRGWFDLSMYMDKLMRLSSMRSLN
jgi:hypothetical protein